MARGHPLERLHAPKDPRSVVDDRNQVHHDGSDKTMRLGEEVPYVRNVDHTSRLGPRSVLWPLTVVLESFPGSLALDCVRLVATFGQAQAVCATPPASGGGGGEDGGQVESHALKEHRGRHSTVLESIHTLPCTQRMQPRTIVGDGDQEELREEAPAMACRDKKGEGSSPLPSRCYQG